MKLSKTTAVLAALSIFTGTVPAFGVSAADAVTTSTTSLTSTQTATTTTTSKTTNTASQTLEHLVYDAETGVLTLHGEFTGTEIRRFKYVSKLTSIVAAEDAVFPESCSNIFYLCDKCEKMDFSKADTSNLKSMQSMFSGCKSLKEVDLSNFDTSNVTKMSYMFSGCSGPIRT